MVAPVLARPGSPVNQPSRPISSSIRTNHAVADHESDISHPLSPCNSRVCYHIPVTPAVSCNYALFRPTARQYPHYYQQLPHSFYCDGGGYPPRQMSHPSTKPAFSALGDLQTVGINPQPAWWRQVRGY